MKTKQTLKLNTEVIEKAKSYAKQHNTSLERLIESYLLLLTSNSEELDEPTPLVKSLSGVLDLPKNFDVKASYKEHLTSKY